MQVYGNSVYVMHTIEYLLFNIEVAMKYLLIIGTCLGLTGCTLNMSMTQATGKASDVVDTHHQQEYDTELNGSLL